MDFLHTKTNKGLLFVNIALAVLYFFYIAFLFPAGNPWLFGLLIAGEVFHLWQVFGYVHAVWPRRRKKRFDVSWQPPVAIFITVTGEPADVVAKTVEAATQLDYPDFRVYILNDGFVANRANWKEAEEVAAKYEVTCITRTKPGGAKAGNINNALSVTSEPFFVVFDADHVPKPSFLKRTMGYFVDQRMAFVQSPQYYKNQAENMVTGGAWEQQALFFGAICKGKDFTNSAFMCGTNMAIRREAIMEVGGMCEDNIAEDFLTSLFIHAKKWKSAYVDEVLAEGLAPEDFLSYYKQQFRWARGSLEVVFRHNPFFKRGLSMAQRVQYLASASFYFSGVIVLLNAALPLVFFYTGLEPLKIATMNLALLFLPYIMSVLYNIQLTSNFSYTFRALSFSLSSFPIHLQALSGILRGKKSGFAVTSKQRLSGNYTYLVTPHLVYFGLVAFGFVVAVLRGGLAASTLTNLAWSLLYVAIFTPFVMAAMEKTAEAPVVSEEARARATPAARSEQAKPLAEYK